jgi:hypothetical protein
MKRALTVLGLLGLWNPASLPVAAQTAVPNLGPDQERITVACGDVTLLLRRQSQWTPGRIDFRGKPMTTERSAYGTVFSFPGVGFIGTAHLENEPEKLTALKFEVDGEALAEPGESLSGNSFRFSRESQIRNFRLKCDVELKNNRLYEATTVTAAEAAPLNLVYHFMHAWTPSVSGFLAGEDASRTGLVSGALTDDQAVARKFYINARVDWMAVYEPKSGQFAVSRLLEAPEGAGNISKIWNVPGAYRKFYLTCFQGQTVAAGFKGTWRMVTGFGSASPEAWQSAATALARDLRE